MPRYVCVNCLYFQGADFTAQITWQSVEFGNWKYQIAHLTASKPASQSDSITGDLGSESQAVDPGLYQQSCCKLNIPCFELWGVCVSPPASSRDTNSTEQGAVAHGWGSFHLAPSAQFGTGHALELHSHCSAWAFPGSCCPAEAVLPCCKETLGQGIY